MFGNKKIIIKNKKPFPYFSALNFFEENFFLSLKKELLSIFNGEYKKYLNKESNLLKSTDSGIDKYPSSFYIGGGKDKDSYNLFLNLSKKNKYLQKFLRQIYTKSFCDSIYNLLEKKNFIKINKLRQPDYKLNFFEFLFFNNYYLNFKISYFKSGSGLSLHRDQGFKEVALLIYMGFTDNLNRINGGTQLFELIKKKSYKDHEVPKSELANFKKIYDHQPLENSICGFKKTGNSWHAVEPLSLPKEVMRINIQINLMRLDSLEKNSILIERIKYKIINFKLFIFKIINKED